MNASGAVRHGWGPTNSANLYGGGDGSVCVRECVSVLAHACARVRARGTCAMCLQYTIIIFYPS